MIVLFFFLPLRLWTLVRTGHWFGREESQRAKKCCFHCFLTKFQILNSLKLNDIPHWINKLRRNIKIIIFVKNPVPFCGKAAEAAAVVLDNFFSSSLLRIMPEFVRDYLKASSPPLFFPFPSSLLPPHPAMATKPLPERKDPYIGRGEKTVF